VKRFLIVFALLAVSTTASAEFKTGNQIISALKTCANDPGRCSKEDYWSYLFAYGYLIGAFDAGHGVTHCSPPGITAGQVEAIFLQKVVEVPQYWNQSADRLVTAALATTWTCEVDNADVVR